MKDHFEDGADLSFQVTVLGFQYIPFKHFGFFTELGIGNEGTLKLGYKFLW